MVGWLGYLQPQPPNMTVGGGCRSYGAPDSPVYTGHVRCASYVTNVVGFRPLELLSSGPAWMSGAPVWACLTSARFWRALNAPSGDRWREVAVALLVHRTVRCTPDMSGEL
jgi:hypothetical protein